MLYSQFSTPSMPLNIIVAGAGLAGLTAAIALVSQGHTVTVYERRGDEDREGSGSGIGLQPNALRVLEKLDMLSALDEVAHNSHGVDVREHDSGNTLVLIDVVTRGGSKYATRRDLKQAIVREAIKRGVKLHIGNGVVSVHEDGLRPVLKLEDHSEVTADLVVGADGTYSHVRRSLYPDYHPKVLPSVVYQVQVPEGFMQKHPDTKELIRNSPATIMHTAPGRIIFSSPVLQTHEYDLQAVDLECPLAKDPHPDVRLGWVSNMDHLRTRFSDHEPGIQKVLAAADRYYKWRLVEVSGLPSWSSPSGKIVLIGDSAHAMTPYAGQGSAMGIEDAAVLAELLHTPRTLSSDELKLRMQLYEKLRRPRCESAQKYAATIGRMWSAKDPRVVKKVHEGMKLINDPKYASVEPDPHAPFVSAAFEKWLDNYDAERVVREAMMDDGKEKKGLAARL